MKKKILDFIITIVSIIVIILGTYIIYEAYYNYHNAKTFRIANWNLKTFGESKSSNTELMQFYSSIIDDYDIIFIQEIKDKFELSFSKLCLMLENYSCTSSSRAGRSSNKEQYGIIYRREINITKLQDYNPDKQDRWERPPIKADFNIEGYSLTVYNIHTKPEDTPRELHYLENIVENSGNVIILGDLNADCSYYDNNKQAEFEDWKWIISDREDTSVSSSSCAYDRIILNKEAYEEYRKHGIYKKEITKNVSDHYLVWVEIKLPE